MTNQLNIEKCLAQFNRISGAFICLLSYVDVNTLNQTYYTYAEVNMDTEKQMIKGTYPNFSIVTIAEQPTRVYERVLRAKCKDKILKEYALDNQLDIIRSVVQHIAELVGKSEGVDIVDLPALQEMNAYIDEVKASNKVLCASYQNRPDYEYVTIAAEQQMIEEQMEGGLHELVYGPRQVNV